MDGARVLREPEVLARVKLGRTTVYRMMREGVFPKSIPLARRAKGWVETEINAWVESQKEKRDAPKVPERTNTFQKCG